jgi:hypothetical protein
MSDSSGYKPCNSFDVTISAVSEALQKIPSIASQIAGKHILLGFDGYIDTLYRLVKNRAGPNQVEFYDKMAEFGQRIVDAAGSSASIERVLKKKLGGGFGPNMARAMANMAPTAKIELYGTMGYPQEDPIFAELPSNVTRYSVGQMGLTLAMEFHDGKIMSQDMEGINTLDWQTLLNRAGGRDSVIDRINTASVIGQGHWALMPHMTDYWKHLLEDILPNVSNLSNKYFFVDPADIQKRKSGDVREMLFTLKKIAESMQVVLSLNDREAIDVSRALAAENVPPVIKGKAESFELAGKSINEILRLHYLVIHEPHFATVSQLNEHIWVTEGYTSKPKFTTAAGDHFNGGFLLGLLARMSPAASTAFANAATAIFVRTGRSPTEKALLWFMEHYFDFIVRDIDTFQFPD